MEEMASFEARTHFSDLLRRVDSGEEFVITLRGRPIAWIVPPQTTNRAEVIETAIGRLAVFREEIAKFGPIVKDGESLKDLARKGLKW